jgi:hypothetical protein
MSPNQIGIVIYRAVLVGAISFIAIELRQLESQLRHPINVSASIDGSVSASLSSSSELDVDVKELAPVDFEKNAFVNSGTLNIEADLHPGAFLGAGPLEIGFEKDTFLHSGLGPELNIDGPVAVQNR